MNFKKILFPVDFSAECQATGPYVEAMAKHFGAEVTMLHVMDQSNAVWYGEYAVAAYAAMVDLNAIRDQLDKQLHGFLADTFEDVPVRRVLKEGDPARIITETAATEHMDLIMLPTHGYGPFRRFILGSVTAKVLHDAQCPVWTGVHLDEKPVKHPECHSVVFAADLKLESLPVMKWAGEMADSFNARLTLIHAVPATDATPDRYFDEELRAALVKEARAELSQAAFEAGFDKAHLCVSAGDVAKVIHHAAESHKADLVIIGRATLQGLLGRLRTHSYSIIRQSPCPVISV